MGGPEPGGRRRQRRGRYSTPSSSSLSPSSCSFLLLPAAAAASAASVAAARTTFSSRPLLPSAAAAGDGATMTVWKPSASCTYAVLKVTAPSSTAPSARRKQASPPSPPAPAVRRSTATVASCCSHSGAAASGKCRGSPSQQGTGLCSWCRYAFWKAPRSLRMSATRTATSPHSRCTREKSSNARRTRQRASSFLSWLKGPPSSVAGAAAWQHQFESRPRWCCSRSTSGPSSSELNSPSM